MKTHFAFLIVFLAFCSAQASQIATCLGQANLGAGEKDAYIFFNKQQTEVMQEIGTRGVKNLTDIDPEEHMRNYKDVQKYSEATLARTGKITTYLQCLEKTLAVPLVMDEKKLPSPLLKDYSWFRGELRGSAPGKKDGAELEIKRQLKTVAPDQDQELVAIQKLNGTAGIQSAGFATMCRDDRLADQKTLFFSRCIFIQFSSEQALKDAKPLLDQISQELPKVFVTVSGPVSVN